jgi:hypothetical protein
MDLVFGRARGNYHRAGASTRKIFPTDAIQPVKYLPLLIVDLEGLGH